MSKKGPAFERAIAKQLSFWWSEGESDDLFWRTQSSGARATQRTKKGKRTDGQYGDICATCPEAKPLLDLFTISIKRGYPELTLDALFSKPNNKKGYGAFINEAKITAKQAGSMYWLLIIKRDFWDTIVVSPIDLNLRARPPIMCLDYEYKGDYTVVRVTKFDQFFNDEMREEIKQIHNKWKASK